MQIPDWLTTVTFEIQHNPNCVKPFLVRLVAPGKGILDHLPYAGIQGTRPTQDVLGFGHSIDEAANEARTERSRRAAAHIPAASPAQP